MYVVDDEEWEYTVEDENRDFRETLGLGSKVGPSVTHIRGTTPVSLSPVVLLRR